MKVAVEKNGLALMYASEFLRHDPDILTAAVNQNRMALRYHTMIGNLDPYLRAGPVHLRLLFKHMPFPFHLEDDIVTDKILPHYHPM